MKKINIAYQLILDFHKKNFKTLSKEIIYFIKKLTVISDNRTNLFNSIKKIENLEDGSLYSNNEIYKEISELLENLNKENSDKEKSDIDDYTDTSRLIDLLRGSSREILYDLNEDREKLRNIKKPTFKSVENKALSINGHIKEFKNFSFRMCFFHARLEIYLARINDLKARLAQSTDLHSSNILHSSTNRRIREKVTDSYTTQISSRCYRDLHTFLCKINNSIYPYDNIPSLYQHQNSSSTSKILSFSSDTCYFGWLNNLSQNKFEEKGVDKGFSALQRLC
ncbi:hypothetical protein [Alteromonas sp. a30]|uniref:hypothetical protein n=1 Tax=Alteromonas sp. a30 TaxID=2730917 RepID=UPI00227F4FB9|nr:hypothetical protein [Alteromonas sp. a30]MCY7297177.1 hypothetical protein [Alteromonas sp. a30]